MTSTAIQTSEKSSNEKSSLNGVDTAGLFATIGAVKAQPELARFQFRSTTRWIGGTHNRSTINGFHGAGGEQTRTADFTVDADHPAVLVGEDLAPTPAEHLLQALGGCLMSGLANIAAARGIELGEVTARVEGDINLLGILGLDNDVRNGFEQIRVVFHVEGNSAADQLAALVEQSRRRSAVYDVLTNGVPVTVTVATA
ncbi:MAG: OsmC family protein [Actinomycetota bacterium]|nr:OsmC family protein [Actinomycetota bacterium]